MSARDLRPSLFTRLDRAERLSDRVADEIQELIVERKLQLGDRLPAERELGEAFGVSRTVIREAIRALVAKGLLDVQPGNGTVVRQPSPSMVSDALAYVLRGTPGGIPFRHAHELRCILEPEIAFRAAERRTEDDLAALEHQLERMLVSEIDWVAADVAFHAALAQAAHNPIFGIVLDSIQDVLLEIRRLGALLPETRVNGARHHRAILEAVAAGDAEAARAAMMAHLKQAEWTMQQVITSIQDSSGLSDRGTE